MNRHPLDPISAVLGVVAVAVGVAVATDNADRLVDNPTMLVALLVVVIGAVMVPMRRTRPTPSPEPTVVADDE